MKIIYNSADISQHCCKGRQLTFDLTTFTSPKVGRALWISNTAYPGYDAYGKKN